MGDAVRIVKEYDDVWRAIARNQLDPARRHRRRGCISRFMACLHTSKVHFGVSLLVSSETHRQYVFRTTLSVVATFMGGHLSSWRLLPPYSDAVATTVAVVSYTYAGAC